MEFLNFLWIVNYSPLFGTIPPLISHFEHDHFSLARIIESSRIAQVCNNLSFGWTIVNSQTPINLRFRVFNPTSTPLMVFGVTCGVIVDRLSYFEAYAMLQ